jgi:hypothetical protein
MKNLTAHKNGTALKKASVEMYARFDTLNDALMRLAHVL